MPYHLAAYTEAIDATANNDVAALNDGIMAIANGHFLPQFNYQLLFAYAGSVTLDRARLNSPSYRQITLPFIIPVNVAALPATPPRLADYRQYPFHVRGLEELAMEATAGPVGTERFNGLIGLSDGMSPTPPGNVFTLRGTGTTAVVANTWTQVPITWADALEEGRYACVGLSAISTTAIAARLTFENQFLRPGCVGQATVADFNHEVFRKGRLGEWGRFRSTRMPLVEWLANAADAVETVYMDLIKVA